MKFSIRRRLLTVAGVGAVTCLFAVYALGRPFAFAGRRSEQAQLGIAREVHRLAAGDRGAEAVPAAPPAAGAAHVGAIPMASTHAREPSPWPPERTARASGDTVWDGRAPHVQPGEAAPTGRIINTLVHE